MARRGDDSHGAVDATGVQPVVDDTHDEHPSDPSKTHRTIIEHARAAASKEQSMTLLQGLKLYPKAVGWSLLISTCIAMEGYDISLVNNFYAFPQFNRKYGVRLADGTYEVPARWQAGLSNGATVGEIIGLFINGFVSERFGYRYTVMACLVLVAAFTAIFFTAPNVETLLVAEILCGIPWGIFQTLTVTYASEVCPVALRGYLTTYVNFCWGLGQEIGIGVIHAMLDREDEWAYRIPYALQWMWPLPLFIGIYFAPESPWWLVRKGKTQEAKKSLLRLTSLNRETDFDADETVAMMVHTTALEEKITAGTSYWDCFKGVDLRRTEIVCMTWAIQNLSGNAFSNYSTYFLKQAGLSEDKSYSFALGQYAINMVGVFGAWGLMTMGIGRRSLYLTQGSLATGSIMIVWALFYQLTIKTVVLGRNLYNVVGIITNVLTPYMLNPSAWNWRNYTGFFWSGANQILQAGICFLCIVYTYFRLPEPRGRTFAELDVLFEKGVSARKFAATEVDVFHEVVEEKVMNQYENIVETGEKGAKFA
ncbi:sugar porter (SP) family MFS transporter [Purpureocillium lavendulum]|uniref:Sugar porter (SP) family MFS transporter n=1 Tax=Purpureocillium lavendulum TaxID=1247861 RepID=A0AB34FTL4_9HYPO|nr:sugar porter (SP) family MFS transporter [Purpureocillium lavendulum]